MWCKYAPHEAIPAILGTNVVHFCTTFPRPKLKKRRKPPPGAFFFLSHETPHPVLFTEAGHKKYVDRFTVTFSRFSVVVLHLSTVNPKTQKYDLICR
jgi:hypothetical protein